MKKANTALFVLVAISSMHCGSPAKPAVATTTAQTTVAPASRNALDYMPYWPSDSMVILSTAYTTQKLRTLGISEPGHDSGVAARMPTQKIDRDAPLWVAMRVSPELIEAASLPLSPTFLIANIHFSNSATSELLFQFEDKFGIESALELFALMKAPLLTRLGLDEEVMLDAKRVIPTP